MENSIDAKEKSMIIIGGGASAVEALEYASVCYTLQISPKNPIEEFQANGNMNFVVVLTNAQYYL